jgi:hypothetical protein
MQSKTRQTHGNIAGAAPQIFSKSLSIRQGAAYLFGV